MSIGSIGGAALGPINFPSFEEAAGVRNGNNAGSNGNFGDRISDALNNLNETQGQADQLSMQVASGNLQDIHDYTIAATKAEVATSLTVAVRNKAVEAFQTIMNMPV